MRLTMLNAKRIQFALAFVCSTSDNWGQPRNESRQSLRKVTGPLRQTRITYPTAQQTISPLARNATKGSRDRRDCFRRVSITEPSGPGSNEMRLIIDSHLDLAWNALSFDRHQMLDVDEINRREANMTDKRCRGRATTSIPELRRAGAAVVVATLLARAGPNPESTEQYLRCDLDFSDQSIAYSMAMGQCAYYQLLEQQGHLRSLKTSTDLRIHWDSVAEQGLDSQPLGYILSMEGADPVVEVSQLSEYWELGLRAIGPAHYGQSHYAFGTGVSGPLSRRGIELVIEMDRLGMLLDVTHLCDDSLYQALDLFHGRVLASHHNCRALVPGDRQLTDDQIKLLIQRDAVIGAAFDAWMLKPGWIRGESSPGLVSLSDVADHTDHICQLAGNANHVAIGTDLDGGFGTEQTPGDLQTFVDVQKLGEIYRQRGYPEDDIDGIFHGNWLRFFLDALPS